MQNLRNKYKNHPVIKPLIDHCDKNNLGFELVKDTRLAIGCIKSFRHINSYYLKIGDNLIETDNKIWHWNDLFKLIVKAYAYLGIEYPDNLTRVAKTFKRQI